MKFEDLNVTPSILKALAGENYTTPTPIQEQAIPSILAGRDLLGCAQTGTGKTAAFAVPILQRLSTEDKEERSRHTIRALVLTPTRELALQIYESFKSYGYLTGLRSCVIFGGVSQHPQVEKLAKGTDILVATPGRLNDLINQKLVNLQHVKIFVLDEADRMLDMGFSHDVKKIIAKIPDKKQTLLFSATMPLQIQTMADTLLINPIKIEVSPVSSTVERINQSVCFVDKANKSSLLAHLLQNKELTSVLVFTRTKHGADRVTKRLSKAKIKAMAIHGNKSQGARQLALNGFKSGEIRVLVATDIAARGIDIDQLPYVINYDIPNNPETYVHRIGRTGRAGMNGTAISFCDSEEKPLLEAIQKLIKKTIPQTRTHPYPLSEITAVSSEPKRLLKKPSRK
ncbi:MAG: box helicase [Clostridia bacterium]|jgi:ATP-dependent RNA helicase RhlE|nr:box helicase [Clostridia bacterium]